MNSFQVDASRCRKEGICAEVCPLRLITFEPGELPFMPGKRSRLCIDCGQCMAFCPAGACTAPGHAFEDIRTLDRSLLPEAEKFEEMVFARRTIRNFREKPVPRDLLLRLLDAVRWAPTGHNRQNLRWIVLESRAETTALAGLVIEWMAALPDTDPGYAVKIRASGFVRAWKRGLDVLTRDAPQMAILVGPSEDMEFFDAASALTYLEMLALAHGVGCCWGGFLSWAFGHSAADAIRDHLEIEPDERLYSAQMLGYPRFTPVSRPPRKPLRVTWR